jgi:hypothetical protein
MRALLSLAMIVGLSVILAIALMRMACFATEECFLFMHTRRRRRDRLALMSQITGYRGIFSNGPLTRFERDVLDVALHPNGSITQEVPRGPSLDRSAVPLAGRKYVR